MPGRNPEGFNPDLSETQAPQSEVEETVDVKPEHKTLQADDFATGSDADYEKPSASALLAGLEAKIAARSAAADGKGVKDGSRINARKGLGSGLRNKRLPTTHAVRAEGAESYGRAEEVVKGNESKDNKEEIVDLIKPYGFKKDDFSLAVSKDIPGNYFFQLFQNVDNKKHRVLKINDTIENIFTRLKKYLKTLE